MNFRSGEIISIKSPIDVHAHLREPGGEKMETIATGTYAALRGGYQAVMDMPNNPNGMQTWSEQRVQQKYALAKASSYTDFGAYAGYDGSNPNIDEFDTMVRSTMGLKNYWGHTTGNTKELSIDDENVRTAVDTWIDSAQKYGLRAPHLLHAREEVGYLGARYILGRGHAVHWCHVASSNEVDYAQKLQDNYPDLFTAEVTPHHLTMTEDDTDKYGWNGARMMPELGQKTDKEKLLWAYNEGILAVLGTDHAPHTPASKFKAESENPTGETHPDCTTCFGISGIEFVLPVMTALVARGKTTMERLEDSLNDQPLKMLGITKSSHRNSITTLRMGPYVINEKDNFGKSTNTPYINWTGWSSVISVMVDGRYRIRDIDKGNKDTPALYKRGNIEK